MRLVFRWGLVCVGAMLALAIPAGYAAASGGLAVVSVSKPPMSRVPGQSFGVTDTVANRGATRRTGVIVRYYLSQTRQPGPYSIVLGRRSIGSLDSGRTSRGSVTAQIPLVAFTGPYHLLACVTVTGTSGRGACAVAAGLIRLVPRPRSVTPALDTADAVSAMITPESGGTLSTTGSDGTGYTLSVPEGALTGPEQITMTPIRSLRGTGLSQPVLAGADLEPSGLVLLKDVTLTITPPRPIPLSEQHGFVYEAGGQDFHRYPLALDKSKIEFQLMHFSAPDLGNGTPLMINTIEHSVPETAVEQEENDLAPPTETIRIGDDSPEGFIRQQLIEGFNEVVVPELRAGEESDAAMQRAFLDSIGWERDVVIYGFSDVKALGQAINYVHSEWIKMSVNAFKRAYERCRNNDQPRQAQITMIQMARFLALHGADPNTELGSDYWNKIETCPPDYLVGVDLTASGTAKNQSSGLGAYGFETVSGYGISTFGLRLDKPDSQSSDTLIFTGTGDLSVSNLNSTPNPCCMSCPYKLGPVSGSPPSTVDGIFEADDNLGMQRTTHGFFGFYFHDYEDVSSCNGPVPHAYGVLDRAWNTANRATGPNDLLLEQYVPVRYDGVPLTAQFTADDATQGQAGTWTAAAHILLKSAAH